jgi:tyrosyl-tRNA synthetase
MSEVEKHTSALNSGINPKDIKMKLAFEIVKFYHGEEEAKKAEIGFVNIFAKGGIPDDAQQILANKGELLRDLLVKEGIVPSNAEWKRLIDGLAVAQMDPEARVSDVFLKVEQNHTYRIGKKRFVKIVIK